MHAQCTNGSNWIHIRVMNYNFTVKNNYKLIIIEQQEQKYNFLSKWFDNNVLAIFEGLDDIILCHKFEIYEAQK
jgi:Leu/Phe-tRNA-protein transferase